MSDITVASRYAKSIFDLSIEKGVLEQVHADFRAFEKVVEENRDLKLLLKNPVVPHLKKWSVLKAIFGDKFHAFVLGLMEITCKKGREFVLYATAKEFHRLYIKHKGIQKATITTTFPLTDALRAEILRLVKGISGKSEVELEELIDPTIIGGFLLRVEDRQLDETLSGKLNELRQSFSKNPYVKEF
jgi:F-type H+-transporting ATPase subunit delta